MKSRLLTALLLVACATLFAAEQPLRIFIRAGKKTHGPAGNGQHDGPTFLKDWTQLLKERGAVVNGRIGFPTAEELENADVIVFYTEEGGTIKPETARTSTNSSSAVVASWQFTIRCAATTRSGGRRSSVAHGSTGTRSGWSTSCPFITRRRNIPSPRAHPNFEFDDEIYYDLHMMPEAKISPRRGRPTNATSKADA